jgi:5'-nucleotidase
VEAIAISTDRRNSGEPTTSPANFAHFAQVANFIARLVGRVQADACLNDGALIGEGLALNVNYPPLGVDDVQGVTVRDQGQASFFLIGYQPVAPGFYAPQFQSADPSGDIATSDTLAFRPGYITVVPIDGNYTSPNPAGPEVRRKLHRLVP